MIVTVALWAVVTALGVAGVGLPVLVALDRARGRA